MQSTFIFLHRGKENIVRGNKHSRAIRIWRSSGRADLLQPASRQDFSFSVNLNKKKTKLKRNKKSSGKSRKTLKGLTRTILQRTAKKPDRPALSNENWKQH